MDDLIVIILTLIVAVAGALGQIKKKKQTTPVTEQEKKPTGFWDLLDEQMDYPGQKDEIIPEVQEVAEIEKPIINTPATSAVYEFKAKPKTNIIRNTEVKKELYRQNQEEKIKEKFSLRKAVIFSEILNRKYT